MIYICIPAYNEEQTVGVLLWKIRQVMLEFPRDYHILVVDDASTDGTPDVLAPYTRVLPLTVIRNRHRLGYARSLELLIREAVRRSSYPRRDVVVTLQADFTDEPAEIETLVKRIEAGSDLVAGASPPPSEAPRSVRWIRMGLGYLLRRGTWPEPLTDPLSGFRAYRIACLRKALDERNGRPLLTWDGWAANAELLRVVAPHARRIDQVEIASRYDRLRRGTRFQPWQTLGQMLRFSRGGEGANGAEERAAPMLEAVGAVAGEAAGGAGRGRRGRKNRHRRRGSRAGQGTQKQGGDGNSRAMKRGRSADE